MCIRDSGIIRVWVDDDMLVDVRDVEMRRSAGLAIDGVSGDVYYDGQDVSASQIDTVVRITPFELRWN